MIEHNLNNAEERIRELVNIIPRNNTTQSSDTAKNIRLINIGLSKSSIVPVICEDMYEFENPETHEKQSLHSFFVEKILGAYSSIISMTEDQLKDIVYAGYYGMSLLEEIIGKDIFEDLYLAVMDEYDRLIPGVQLKTEVLDFLEACKFKLIITTSCFPILEQNLGKEYESFWYEMGKKSDAVLPTRCIYHLFGKANPNNDHWGYNEKQLLSFLRLAYSDYPLSNLTSFNNNKTLLILGNDAPDWLFRFILTPLYKGDIYNESKTGFYMSSKEVSEESLDHFLREINFKSESQLKEVLSGVTTLQRSSHVSEESHGHNKKYDFFIAHASEDKKSIEKLVERMTSGTGLKVWVDYSKIHDGPYWERIIDGIKNSAYFMPVVSEDYMYKIKKKKYLDGIISGMNDSDLFSSERCLDLEEPLGGVQLELLLASKWFSQHPVDVYSIPVLLKGAEFCGDALTLHRISEFGKKDVLPKNLFAGIQGYEFDSSEPESFNLEWNRYKSIV